jgi:hypothetical protein
MNNFLAFLHLEIPININEFLIITLTFFMIDNYLSYLWRAVEFIMSYFSNKGKKRDGE